MNAFNIETKLQKFLENDINKFIIFLVAFNQGIEENVITRFLWTI
jgi:hypothetical protein